jgi:hypothetical protein
MQGVQQLSLLQSLRKTRRDMHRGDGKRFVVRSDEKLTAFLELEATIRAGDETRPVT